MTNDKKNVKKNLLQKIGAKPHFIGKVAQI